MTIKTAAAVVYRPNTPFVIEEATLEPPGEGEVLVELKAAGPCHADFGVLEGHSPLFDKFRSCSATRAPAS